MENGISVGLLQGLCPASASDALGRAGCFVATWEIPLLFGLAVVLVLAFLWWRRRRAAAATRTPMLVFPLQGSAPQGEHRSAARLESVPPRNRQSVSQPEHVSSPGEPRAHEDPAPEGTVPESASPKDTMVRYERPPDGTLQLLPGRLEIERGPGAGEELRFVRVPGAPPEVTIGRGDGPEYRHIQLRSPTVSRTHARLRFVGNEWTISNESSTNPTRVNDRILSSDVEQVGLVDEDRIEIGEITFVFRYEGTGDRLPTRSSWYTDRGRRASNQDAVVVRTLEGGRELAAVCDGMGSHRAGGVASHRAIDGLVASLRGGADLAGAVEAANRAVLEAAAESEENEGIGTTMVALLRDGDRYDIANVGDSRAYRLGAGVEQLTVDHSFVAEATRDGGMSQSEAERSPWRNAVTRNLGAGESVDTDLFPGFDATADHVVILCTDGVHGVLSDEAIGEVFRKTSDVRDLSRALGEEALVQGGEDNVAIAAVRFGRPRTAGDQDS